MDIQKLSCHLRIHFFGKLLYIRSRQILNIIIFFILLIIQISHHSQRTTCICICLRTGNIGAFQTKHDLIGCTPAQLLPLFIFPEHSIGQMNDQRRCHDRNDHQNKYFCIIPCKGLNIFKYVLHKQTSCLICLPHIPY